MNRVLVCGATGNQGGGLVQALKDDPNYTVVALSRDPTSPAADKLRSQGIEVVQGNLDSPTSLVSALRGCTAAFLVAPPMQKNEVEQGKAFVDAAKQAGVEFLVYSSVEGAERGAEVETWKAKWAVEEYLRASGIAYTILRPTGFYQNYGKTPTFMTRVFLGLSWHYDTHGKTQLISTHDIGRVAALAIRDQARYAGRAIPLAGDALSMKEIVEVYRREGMKTSILGRVQTAVIHMFLPAAITKMYIWLRETGGFKVDVEACRAEFGLQTFGEWLAAQ
ncbi:hypothetical protein JCM8097_004655 [Rhodosporidiobolus ruineniae]